MEVVYKKGDRVIVKRSDWPKLIPVGSIQVISAVAQIGTGGYINNYYFAGYEIELVDNNNMDKKLVGYKLKDEKYKQAALALCSGSVNWQDTGKVTLGVNENVSIPLLQQAGVLDLWFTPVYENTEIVVNLSDNRTATITSKSGAIITFSDSKVPVTALSVATALKAFESLGQIAGYNVGVSEFNLGCQTFTINDLVLVDKAFKEFK